MKTIYIKEYNNEEIYNKKIPKFIRNVMLKIIKNTNMILKKDIDENKKIYFIQNIKSKSVYNRVRKKINKEETKTNKVQVVLSNKIKQYEQEFKNYRIIKGKNIFQNYIEQIIKMIVNRNTLALEDVYILTNKYCNESVSLIRKMAPEVKSMNIVTKEINKYMMLEEMLAKQGLIVCIANNKKKSLKKAKIIINIDLNEAELRKYTIHRNSIIINLSLEKIKELKLFDGLIVQDIVLNLEEKERKIIEENGLNKEFKNIEIYESLKEQIDTNKIQISNIMGKNGIISKKELINVQKILTNEKN